MALSRLWSFPECCNANNRILLLTVRLPTRNSRLSANKFPMPLRSNESAINERVLSARSSRATNALRNATYNLRIPIAPNNGSNIPICGTVSLDKLPFPYDKNALSPLVARIFIILSMISPATTSNC